MKNKIVFFCGTVSGRLLPVMFSLLFVMASTRKAMCESLDHHHRELLQARVEDLLLRLCSNRDLRSLDHGRIDIEPVGQVQVRSIAGVDISRLAVRLRGQLGLVLTWLSDACRANVLFKPPLELSSEKGIGRKVVVDVVLWQVGSKGFDRGVSDEQLTKLKDDLLWHEAGLKDSPFFLALMDNLMDFEQVHLQMARLEKGILSVRAIAVDGVARAAFQALLEDRAKALSHVPKLQMDISYPSISKPTEESPPGLIVKDCPVYEAVAVAGLFAQKQFILVSAKDALLNGMVNGVEPSGLFRAVAEKSSIPQRTEQGILVISSKAKQLPVELSIDSKQPLSLSISPMVASDVLRHVGRSAGIQVIVPDGVDDLLTVRVSGVQAGKLLSILAWAVGLKAVNFDDMVVMYYPSMDGVSLESSMGKVRIDAYHAPLVELVKLLGGLGEIEDCDADKERLVDLSLHFVDSSRLLNGLLRGFGKTILVSKGRQKLVDVENPDAGLSTCRSGVDRPPVDPGLYAVVSSGKKRFALIAQGGRFTWLSKGDRIGDGRRVARIHSRRVVLTDESGQTMQVFLGPGEKEQVPKILPGPTRQALGDLRLVGTMRLPEYFSVALVQNTMGDVFVLSKGNGIGRRCGKVTSIGSGSMEVRLECAIGKEPERSTLFMSGKW